MKVIKPQKLGVLTRVFEHGREVFFVPTVFACFPFDVPSGLFTEQAMWQAMTEELGPGAALDLGLPKPTGEVLVDAHAYAPGGVPQPGVEVELSLVSGFKKALWVSGDRRWELLGMTMPEPFVSMPIDWAHAFGGPGFAENPLGRGASSVVGPDGKRQHLVPNVEYPNERVMRSGEKPRPASFRAIDPTWPQRTKRLGTYDARWLEREAPGYARDIDLSMFNAAPEDQRIAGFFRGDEAFVLTNMHPEEPRLSVTLPSLVARVFVTLRDPPNGPASSADRSSKGRAGPRLVEVPMRIDTVHLFPHRKMGVIASRGLLPIREDDAHDVIHLLVAAERLGAARDLGHYEAVLDARLDKERGGLLALRDKDLLPDLARFAGDDPFVEPLKEKLAREGLLERNAYERSKRSWEERREKIAALGLEPEGLLGAAPEPPQSPAVDLDELVALVDASERELAQEEKTIEASKSSAEVRARALATESGIDYDEAIQAAESAGGGPPAFSAQGELDKIREATTRARAEGVPMLELEALLEDPAFIAKLEHNERSLRDLYRRFAHTLPEVRVDGALANVRGDVVEAALGEGSIAERDFSGANLKGRDLRGKDLSYAFLEKCDLTGANLAGVDLTGAVLTRARLVGANLSGARLSATNLGDADLTDAVLDGATLDQVTFDGARLSRAKLRGATIEGGTWSDTSADEVDLSRSTAQNCIWQGSRFERARWDGVTLRSCLFLECDLQEAHLDGASLLKTAFIGVRGAGLSLRDAKADNTRFVAGCDLSRADLRGARLRAANLRGASLVGADASGLDAEGADFSEVEADGARFVRALLREARFVRADLRNADFSAANLIMAIVQKAEVAGARFAGANLFRADFAHVRGDDQTTFRDAYVDQVRFLARAT